jgi:imidazolonepropionase-like amidohydrolase
MHVRSLPAILLLLCAAPAAAQRPTPGPAVRPFVAIDTVVVALTRVRLIDGTGAPPREDQTLVIENGTIAALGAAGSTPVPPGARTLDLSGKTVIPGLVMMHEHLFYPTGGGVYGNLTGSFPKLYLAGGVTTMRTAGNANGYGELAVARAIKEGLEPGPWIDATGPYLEGKGSFTGQMHELTDSNDARRMVDFWADAGATSFKAYMHITRAELSAAIAEVHRRGMKITGHLCSVTYREAAHLGIDNLEHGFMVSTDFVRGKQPDVCPGQRVGAEALAEVSPDDSAFRSLVADLVARHVAVTTTPTVFETFVPGRPVPPGLDVLEPQLKAQFLEQRAALERRGQSIWSTLLQKNWAMERVFVRAGGLLLVGTDPTGYGGVVPGFSDQRALELLVEEGFTPLEAIKIGTLNGATYLGRADRIGSLAVGKQADLLVIDGNPASDITDVRKIELVFRQGVAYDPVKLIDVVKGKVGLF